MVTNVTAGALRRPLAALGGAMMLAAAMGGSAQGQDFPPAPDFSDAVSLFAKAAPEPAPEPAPTPVNAPSPSPAPAATPAAELLSQAPALDEPEPKRLALLDGPGPDVVFRPAPAPTPAPMPEPAPAPAPAPAEDDAPSFGVQVAAYQSRDDARAARDRLSAQVDVFAQLQARAERVERGGGALYRLKFGPYNHEADAAAACAALKAAGGDCFVRDFSGEPLG